MKTLKNIHSLFHSCRIPLFLFLLWSLISCQNTVIEYEKKNSPSSVLQSWRESLPLKFQTAQTLQSLYSQQPLVKANDNGDVILVWRQDNGNVYNQIYKSERRSGVWIHPKNLYDTVSFNGSNSVGYFDISFNNNGDAIIVWTQSDGTYDQIYKAEYRSGIWIKPLNAADNISPDGSWTGQPHVKLNHSGEILVVWRQYDGTANDHIFKSEYRAGTWTHPTGLSDHISPVGFSANNPQMALADNGEAVITWNQNDGTNDQIFMSQYRSGAWTHPTGLGDHISPSGTWAYSPFVAMSPSGEGIITWTQSNGSYNQIFKSEYRSGAWTHPSGIGDHISVTGSGCGEPKVSLNSNGDALIVWRQYDGAKDQIFKSQYLSGTWTHPINLADNISPDGQWTYYYDVAYSDNGDAVIVWEQSDGLQDQLFKSEYRSGTWTHPANLADNISPDDTGVNNPMVSMNSNGSTYITWAQSNGSNDQVYLSLYESGSWIHPVDLNDHNYSVKKQASVNNIKIATNIHNHILVTWAQSNGTNTQVYKSQYINGNWIHPTGFSDSVSINSTYANNAKVVLNNNNEALLVWDQWDGSYNRIYKAEYRNGSWSYPANLSDNISPLGSNAYNPQVALNLKGQALIVWDQFDGTYNQIFKSEYKNNTWTHPTGLSDNISPDGEWSQTAQLAMSDNGDAVVTWSQGDGSTYQIFKAEYRSGSWSFPTGLQDNISPDGTWAYNPNVAINEHGVTLISWHQSDGTNDQIYKAEYRNGIWSSPSGLTDKISPSGNSAYGAKPVINNNGESLIVWQQYDTQGIYQIFKSEYKNDSWTHPVDLNDSLSQTTVSSSYFDVEMGPSGSAMVIWNNYHGTLSSADNFSGQWNFTSITGQDNPSSFIDLSFLSETPFLIYSHISSDPYEVGIHMMEYK